MNTSEELRVAAGAATTTGAGGAVAGPAAREQRPSPGEFTGWRTSSYSGGGNECVALATVAPNDGRGGWVAVRDTKHVGGGPVIVAPRGAVAALVDWVR